VSALPGRAWRALARFADGPRAAPALVAAALLVYGLVSYALPLAAGRDLARYLLVYAQLFDAHVVYPHAVLTRTPVAPLVVGGLLDAGPLVAEVGAAALYAFSVLAWCSVARRFGAAAAVATAAALLLYPGYVLIFHQLSSDAVFAAAFSLFAVCIARALERPSAGRAAVLGASVALLVLVRPVAQVLLLLALVPLVAAGTWQGRIRATTAFVLAAGLPLLGWFVHNGARLDDFTVARGGGASLPLFRAFVADRIVEPENGPASRELARAVARDLLPNEPYRSYGIDLDRFFSSGSSRMHDDLIVLADRTWGWDDDYRHLSRVGREAVRAHPASYLRGVTRDAYRLLVWPLYPAASASEAAGVVSGTPVSLAGGLPPPSEEQPIPSARTAPYLSTPDGRIREVWTSATEHHIVFSDPADTARAAALDRRVDELLAALPDRPQRNGLVRWLERASRWFPRPALWLVVGLAALAWRRPRGSAIPLAIAGAALLVLVSTALAVYAVAEYSVPVAPAFILLATVGVVGRYRPVRGAPEAAPRV
jgi:Dolichyl-phosphate-mannose-protein mannosyltransferase